MYATAPAVGLPQSLLCVSTCERFEKTRAGKYRQKTTKSQGGERGLLPLQVLGHSKTRVRTHNETVEEDYRNLLFSHSFRVSSIFFFFPGLFPDCHIWICVKPEGTDGFIINKKPDLKTGREQRRSPLHLLRTKCRPLIKTLRSRRDCEVPLPTSFVHLCSVAGAMRWHWFLFSLWQLRPRCYAAEHTRHRSKREEVATRDHGSGNNNNNR